MKLINFLCLSVFCSALSLHACPYMGLGLYHTSKVKPKKKIMFRESKEIRELRCVSDIIKVLSLAVKNFPFEEVEVDFVDKQEKHILQKVDLQKENLCLCLNFYFNEANYVSLPLNHSPVFLDNAIEASTGIKISFATASQFDEFKKLLSYFISYLNLRKAAIYKIICLNSFSRDNLIEPVCKILNSKQEEGLDAVYDVKADIDYPYFYRLLNVFNNNYSFYTELEKSKYSNNDFLVFAINFLSILNQSPHLIYYVDIEIFVNIIKKIYLEFSHIETVEANAKNLFLNNSRTLLMFFRHLTCIKGEVLYKYALDHKILEEDFYSLVRIENDIIWLAYMRILLTQNIIKTKDDFNDLYNFEELIKVSQTKIILACYLFSLSSPKNWKTKITLALSDKFLEKNIANKKDFTCPYGRWGQAGQVLEKYIKEKGRKQLNKKLPTNFEQNILSEFISANTYKEAIEKISLIKFTDNKDVFEIITDMLN